MKVIKGDHGLIVVDEDSDINYSGADLLNTVYENGKLLNPVSLSTIRERLS